MPRGSRSHFGRRVLSKWALPPLVFLVALTPPVWSTPPHFFIGDPRFAATLGRGGAGVAVANDADLLFENPAGLGFLARPVITPLRLEAGASTDFWDAYRYLSPQEDELTRWEELSLARRTDLLAKIRADI